MTLTYENELGELQAANHTGVNLGYDPSDQVRVTDHAHDRIKQRLGLGKSAHQRAAENAMVRGRIRTTFSGRLRRYLDGAQDWYQSGELIIYGGFVWVFAGLSLVTVYQLPVEYRALAA